MKVYKEVRIRNNGTLGPLFVGTQEVFPIGEIICATMAHRRYMDKIYSKLGWLKFRPGLHLTIIPYAPHIGIKDKDGVIRWMHDDTVWVECEIPDDKDYTEEAHRNGIGKNGKFNAKNACLDHLPEYGYYWYTTNPNAKVDWLIAHRMIITRILTDDEVADICAKHGIVALPHRNNKYLELIERKVA